MFPIERIFSTRLRNNPPQKDLRNCYPEINTIMWWPALKRLPCKIYKENWKTQFLSIRDTLSAPQDNIATMNRPRKKSAPARKTPVRTARRTKGLRRSAVPTLSTTLYGISALNPTLGMWCDNMGTATQKMLSSHRITHANSLSKCTGGYLLNEIRKSSIRRFLRRLQTYLLFSYSSTIYFDLKPCYLPASAAHNWRQ